MRHIYKKTDIHTQQELIDLAEAAVKQFFPFWDNVMSIR